MKKMIVAIVVVAIALCFSFVSPLCAEEINEFEAYSKESIVIAYTEKKTTSEKRIIITKEEVFDIIKEEIKNKEERHYFDDVEIASVKEAGIIGFKRWSAYSSGWLAGFLSHELGHVGAAKLMGVKTKCSNILDPRLNHHSNSNRKLRIIDSGGFDAEIISSEIILGIDAIPKNNPFFIGWLAFDVVNPIYYALIDKAQSGHGDMESFRRNGVNTNFVKIAMLAHSALSVYRFFEKPSSFTPYIGVNEDQITAGLIWKW